MHAGTGRGVYEGGRGGKFHGENEKARKGKREQSFVSEIL